jgi:hypothetical protein
MVKDIVQELNNEHQALEFEKSPTPENDEEPRVDDSTIPLSDNQTIGPQRTSEFEQTNPDEGHPVTEREISQEKPQADTSTKSPPREEHGYKVDGQEGGEAKGDKQPTVEEEHSTTNTHQSMYNEERDDHVMDTDEFLNSTADCEHSAKSGGSNADEGNSVSKPPTHVYLPPDILQSLKDLTPDEALDKLLSNYGAYTPALSDRERATQLEQTEHEARFRREVLEGDILEFVEKNPSLYPNVKALFSTLQTSQTREDLFLLVSQAESFLDQYIKHSQQLQLNSQTQQTKLKLKEQHFAQAKQRHDEATKLKAESAGAFLQMASCDENISLWRAEIRELETKIAEEEKRREEFAAQAAAVSRTKIEELAQDGIKQCSEGLVVSKEVDRLANENIVIRRKLAHTKEQYHHFRNANKDAAV